MNEEMRRWGREGQTLSRGSLPRSLILYGMIAIAIDIRCSNSC